MKIKIGSLFKRRHNRIESMRTHVQKTRATSFYSGHKCSHRVHVLISKQRNEKNMCFHLRFELKWCNYYCESRAGNHSSLCFRFFSDFVWECVRMRTRTCVWEKRFVNSFGYDNIWGFLLAAFRFSLASAAIIHMKNEAKTNKNNDT